VTLASQAFLFLFLPAVLALHALAPRRARQALLVLASLAFCAWAGPWFVVPLAVVIVVDHACGRVIAARAAAAAAGDRRAALVRRLALGASLAVDLGLLGVFKYAGFAADNLDAVLRALSLPGVPAGWWSGLALPLGISFYTFQSIAYTVDVYYARTEPARSLVEYALFLSFFPRLTAGPIVRFGEFSAHLRERAPWRDSFARGVVSFSFGLAKKTLLADPCGAVADTVFNAASRHPLDAWIGLLAFAFQIYFDFSGYTDMAIGAGRMLGLELPQNFDRPYLARSVTEFWRRWHITLSNWLRDFLFLPIAYAAGRRFERLRLAPRSEEYASYVTAAVTTMALAGLWHGAAWTFVAWGLVHGIAMAAERGVMRRRFYKRTPDGVKIAVTFGIVLLAWVFFRSASLADAAAYLASLVGAGSAGGAAGLLAAVVRTPANLAALAAAAAVVWLGRPTVRWAERPTLAGAALAGVLLLAGVAAVMVTSQKAFLYSVF
jgi:alginate O-acetyltransferase complex protein AlgI